LPEAHVEAPTVGSIILAGIILKLGIYAMFRFLLGSFINILYELIFFIFIISLFGLIYSSLVALNQIDVKKLIAYSSIAHMNFALLGVFCNIFFGLVGSFVMLLAHGLTSSALFFGIGVLYDRYRTRIIFYYGGLVCFMPIFSILYLFLLLANFGFPGTFNFVGEFLILLGSFNFSHFILLLSAFAMVLSLIYSLFFFNRLFFGLINLYFLRFFSDCNRLEFLVLFFFVFFIFFLGLFPYLLADYSILFLFKFCFFY
jgi:NADH:ubiquinone oxidoreductase subunit 4 (subunit M)